MTWEHLTAAEERAHAEACARTIEKVWCERGYYTVRAQAVAIPCPNKNRQSLWVIRTNLDRRGLPPEVP